MKQNISYKKRNLAALMRQSLKVAPVIVLSGVRVRQVGSCTLVGHLDRMSSPGF